jgi:hypothetical protein
VQKNSIPKLHKVTGGDQTKMYCQGAVYVRCVLAVALRNAELGLTEVENQAKPLKYSHLWLVQLYSIFLHYIISGTIFEKMLLDIKCMF